jgi:serine/threonine-protein kinase
MVLENRSPSILCFGVFELDLRAHELRKQGVRIKIQEQPFHVLKLLLQRSGEVVTREELRAQIWHTETFVDFDNGLNTAINRLREAIGDYADNPRFIETVPRRGYRFIATVTTEGANTSAVAGGSLARTDVLSGGGDTGATQGSPSAGETPALQIWRRTLTWRVAAGVMALALVSIALRMALRPAPRSALPLRLSVELGADASLDSTLGPAAALSRDGNVLAFTARPRKGGPTQLFIRQLDRAQATPQAGTDNAFSPFFSPDGQWIAFFADGKLKKISVTGGAALILCDAPEGRGGDWGEDGNIALAPSAHSGLFRVPEVGGKPSELTKLDLSAGEWTHRWPQVLPGGKAVLFTQRGSMNFDDATIVVQSLITGQRKIVQRGGTFGRYLPGGYLVYLHSGTLFGAPFDVDRLELVGAPVPAVEGMERDAEHGGAQIAFSSDGTLLYLPDQSKNLKSTILWMERDGKTASLRSIPARYSDPRFSPDGRRLAIDLIDEKGRDIWVYEWQRNRMLRFTLGAGENERPVWTPDGLRIAFASDRAERGVSNIYWQRSDVTGEIQRLTESNNPQRPNSWHPNGKFLAFAESNPQTGSDIMILPLEGSEVAGWKPGKPFAFVNSASNEGRPVFSPDGRWLAYWSDESGRSEVYVRPFPGPGAKRLISTNGGTYPTWSSNGKELFYQDADAKIMVAAYTASGSMFQAEKPRAWSAVSLPLSTWAIGELNYDVSPDGKRLVVAPDQAEGAAKEDKITFLFNFTDQLRRIAPPAKK